MKFTKIQFNLNFIRKIYAKRKSSNAQTNEHVIVRNIQMRRLSEESLNFVDANPNIIYNKTNKLKIKQIDVESDVESEREEETIMDTIVRQDSSHFKYKRIKRADKSNSEYAFQPNVFIPFS